MSGRVDGLLESAGAFAGEVAVFFDGLRFGERVAFSPDFTLLLLLLRVSPLNPFVEQVQGAVSHLNQFGFCLLVQF